MTSDVLAELMELLIGFKSKGNIEAVVVASRSGVNLASSVPLNTNADTLAAMSSALKNAADIMIGQGKNDLAQRVVIECERSKLIIVGAGNKALIVVLAGENSSLGPLFVEIDHITYQIREMLDSC
ncbi:MAG: roadblock/LC7 domain-containing protein [ANME-2 cluster archaeon]|nr:roadblock/LC7 domain-containing protein [ANME-2 cluster archaeon]